MSADAPPVLSIGAVLGDSDPENMAWKRAIHALSREVKALRDGVDSPLRVNVVFHVNGKLAPNEFEGVRTAKFDGQAAHLMIQAAVPPGPAEDRRSVLEGLLRTSVEEAERFASGRGLASQLPEIRGLVRQLAEG